jgi:tetratricopeptide (TPR) repeat protein
MENKKDNITSIMLTGNTSLNRTSSSLAITNKLLFGDIQILFNEAFFLINRKHLQGIEENYCMWLELDCSYIERNDFKFKAKEQNDYIRAIDLFAEVLKIKPGHYFSSFFKGIAYYRLRKYDAAIIEFSRAIEFKNDITYFYKYRGVCFDELERFEYAIDDFETCIKLVSEEPEKLKILSELHHNLGNARFRIDQEKSLADYNKALQLDDENIRCYNNRGRTLRSLDKKEEAKNDFITAIELCTKKLETNKDDCELWFYRGWAEDKLAMFKEAIIDYNKAIELIGDNEEYFFCRGRTKISLNDYEGAINDFTYAIEITPNNAFFYYYRGKASIALKDYEGAIEDFTNAIEINPNYANFYYFRGRIRNEIKDYEGAIEDYTKAIEINPYDADFYNNRGFSKEEIKDFEGAVADKAMYNELTNNL